MSNGVNRLDIELSGKLNSEDMKIALDELVSKSKNIEKGKMLYEIIDFHLPSLGAIGVEFSRLPADQGYSQLYDLVTYQVHLKDRAAWGRLDTIVVPFLVPNYLG